MDDNLYLWLESADNLNLLFATLNNKFPIIKFTIKGGGEAINFLDVNVSIVNNCHEFAIFRKNTYMGITIHGSSFCHPSHKDATFHGYIYTDKSAYFHNNFGMGISCDKLS